MRMEGMGEKGVVEVGARGTQPHGAGNGAPAGEQALMEEEEMCIRTPINEQRRMRAHAQHLLRLGDGQQHGVGQEGRQDVEEG
jgi:hypothetical protein